MQFHFQQAIRAFILLIFPIFIIKLHVTGEITKFINPKYEGLSQAAAVIFLLLFLIQLTRIWKEKKANHQHCDHGHQECTHHHDHGDTPFNIKKLISYSIIVFPLITGFLLPAKVLDASIASKKGGMSIIANQKQASPEQEREEIALTDEMISEDQDQNRVTENETEMNESELSEHIIDPIVVNQQEMLEKDYENLKKKLANRPNVVIEEAVYSTYYEDIHKDVQKYKGKKIKLKGFVYKEEGFKEDQLVISRFLITHCVADASIVGFIAEIPGASSIETDTWIEATGVLDVTDYQGLELPLIKITDWKEISEPKEPYIYPINIRIL